jgi:hypothetical protein
MQDLKFRKDASVVHYVTDGSKNAVCFIKNPYQMRRKGPIALTYTHPSWSVPHAAAVVIARV